MSDSSILGSVQERTHGGGGGARAGPPWDLKNIILSGSLP